MRRILVVSVFVVVALALAAGAWFVASTIRDLKSSLMAERHQVTALKTEIEQRTQALEQARAESQVARGEAARAGREAEQTSAAADAARAAQENAEKARLLAEQQAIELTARENRTRQELDAIRQRRQRELDRMQEALSKIAPTRRTASGMVIELANDSFYFDFDKASLRPENREVLSRIAGVLLASDGYRLFVYGHTDDIGQADYNQNLSERRAQSVADYLRQAGVPEEGMHVKGYGKSSPRVNSHTQQARQKNRRVEIGVVDSVISYPSTGSDSPGPK
ncbi:MAG TPA: OmpA family protein [Bryobacteraceae bacterium]|nr:OmpA family protein [Bryobacteraceae bacterium]